MDLPKPQRETRTLRELFPDKETRCKAHHDFAHKFIGPYVFQNPRAFFSYLLSDDPLLPRSDPTKFIHSRWTGIFERHAGLNPGRANSSFGVADLTMSLVTVGGFHCALIRMPPPENPLAAYFVGIVLLSAEPSEAKWAQNVQAKVYTLEKLHEPGAGKGILCEWTEKGDHVNWCAELPVDSDVFLSAIARVLAAKPEAPAFNSLTIPRPTQGQPREVEPPQLPNVLPDAPKLNSKYAGNEPPSYFTRAVASLSQWFSRKRQPGLPADKADAKNPKPTPPSPSDPSESSPDRIRLPNLPPLEPQLENPLFIAEPVFAKADYLSPLAHSVFARVLVQIQQPELAAQIKPGTPNSRIGGEPGRRSSLLISGLHFASLRSALRYFRIPISASLIVSAKSGSVAHKMFGL